MVDKYNWNRGPATPAAPNAGNPGAKGALKANARTVSPAAAQPKKSKSDGNVRAEMKKHGQHHAADSLAESAAQRLYPSAKKKER